LRGITEGERLAFVTQSALKWLLRTEVVAILHQIVSWLGLDVSQQALEASVESHRFERMPATGPQEFVRSAAPGSWRENLREDEQSVVERLLGGKLRELGYDA
jgi:hypothetical protein